MGVCRVRDPLGEQWEDYGTFADVQSRRDFASDMYARGTQSISSMSKSSTADNFEGSCDFEARCQ